MKQQEEKTDIRPAARSVGKTGFGRIPPDRLGESFEALLSKHKERLKAKDDRVASLENKMSALAEELKSIQKPKGSESTDSPPGGWPFGDTTENGSNKQPQTSVRSGSEECGGKNSTGLKSMHKHDEMLRRLDGIHTILAILFVAAPGYFLLTLRSSIGWAFKYATSSGVSIPNILVLVLLVVLEVVFATIPMVLFANGLSYRIIHVNKLHRRVTKDAENKTTEGEVTKEKCAEVPLEQDLALRNEVEDLVWKIFNPSSFLPGEIDWAQKAIGDEFGVYQPGRKWNQGRQQWETIPGQLAY